MDVHVGAPVAQFFCFIEGKYLCTECYQARHGDHKNVQLYCDSITNHLGRFFNEWIQLYDYLVNDLLKQLDASIDKYRSLLDYLHMFSEVRPDISPFFMQLILRKLAETVRN